MMLVFIMPLNLILINYYIKKKKKKKKKKTKSLFIIDM